MLQVARYLAMGLCLFDFLFKDAFKDISHALVLNIFSNPNVLLYPNKHKNISPNLNILSNLNISVNSSISKVI
jgi:hypothetical protein